MSPRRLPIGGTKLMKLTVAMASARSGENSEIGLLADDVRVMFHRRGLSENFPHCKGSGLRPFDRLMTGGLGGERHS